jgi:hypothetical protein
MVGCARARAAFSELLRPFHSLARSPLPGGRVDSAFRLRDTATQKMRGRRRSLARGIQFGITSRVMDCAGKVALMVLAVLPLEGGVIVAGDWETIAFRLALL